MRICVAQSFPRGASRSDQSSNIVDNHDVSLGLRRAVTHPNRNPSTMPFGTCLWQKLQKFSMVSSHSTNPRCVRLTCHSGPVRPRRAEALRTLFLMSSRPHLPFNAGLGTLVCQFRSIVAIDLLRDPPTSWPCQEHSWE